ncbi:MAG: AsmA-like C-terminal region-containing protein [Bacteroidales bacterium]
MKKALKVSGIVFGVILLLLIILPFAFKGTIIKKIKEETNKSLNAKVDFNNFGLSLFRSFPDFSLSMDGLTVVGVDEFKADTLASVPKLYITIDLMSVIKGSEYKINKIQADDARILLKGLKNGKVNWDIVKPGDTTKPAETPTEPSKFKMEFKKIQLNNAHIVYDDAGMGFYMLIDGLDHTSSGDMTADLTTLKTITKIKQLDVDYGGVRYLSKSDAEIKLDMGMDMKNMKFTFKENTSRLNQLFFQFDGFFAMLKDGGYDMDIKLKTDKTDFKNILSMVPALYAKDFDKIESKGKLVFDGFFKGIYKDLNTLPAFALNFQIINGMFKYPGLPKEVNNVNIVCKIDNKGGSADNTTIDISNFHIELGGNPLDLRLFLSTPVSDPNLNMNIKGALDMASLKQVYPMEAGQDIEGSFKADITMKGKMSSIKQEKYNEFVAQGYLDLQNMKYKSKDFTQNIDIKAARLNFAPQFLELAKFDMLIGKNDFSAKGKIENYIAYWLKGETIKGKLETKSTYFNLNDLMAMAPKDSAKQTVAKETNSQPMSVFKVPANIDFYMTADFTKLIYDKMDMEKVNGVIELKDQKLSMKNLSMNMLNGKMILSGYYSSKVAENPEADFTLDISNFDIQKAMKTFATMGKMVPIAEKTSGSFSTKFKVNTLLDKTMSPVTNSMKGGGNLSTSKIVIENSETMNKLADAIKYEKLKKLSLDKLNITFLIADGKVITSPFDIKIDNAKAKVSGSTGFDETIDYLMKMEVPRKDIGGAANSLLEGLAGKANEKGVGVKLADVLKFDIRIGGTFKNPVIKTGLKDSKDNAVNDLKDKAKEEFDKKKEAITNKAKEEATKAIAEARKKADQLVTEANKQGNALRSEAKKGGDQLITEADAQGKKIVDAASNPITKIAAKKAADKLHNEAVNKANKLNFEADQKASDMENKAKNQGDQMIKAAEDKAK